MLVDSNIPIRIHCDIFSAWSCVAKVYLFISTSNLNVELPSLLQADNLEVDLPLIRSLLRVVATEIKQWLCGTPTFLQRPDKAAQFAEIKPLYLWEIRSNFGDILSAANSAKKHQTLAHTWLKLSMHNRCNSEQSVHRFQRTHTHTQLHHPAPITTAVTSHVRVSDSHKTDKKGTCSGISAPQLLRTELPGRTMPQVRSWKGPMSPLGRGTMGPCGSARNGYECAECRVGAPFETGGIFIPSVLSS